MKIDLYNQRQTR